jgi:hypothetical protein
MDTVGEHPLERGPATPVEPRVDRLVIVGAAVLLLVVAGVAAFYLWRRAVPVNPATAPPAADARAPAAARGPLGPAVETGPLPPLDQSDPLVRQLLGGLSSHPQVVAWLATDDLVRRFVVSLDNVATGSSPARHLRVLAPAGPFEVQARGETLTIAERSFQRYDALGDAVSSLNPQALAALYSRLKPRLQEAYVELGEPGGGIDAAVEQAIVRLLDAPAPGSDVVLEPGIVSFKFQQERFETLTAAQKQLVRMGPRNARLIQAQLWALGRELGIPSERLPPPPR